MRALTVIFYAGFLILIGLTLIFFAVAMSTNMLHAQDIQNFLVNIQYDLQSRVIIGLAGLLLILVSFSFAQLILGKFQREKTIAFTNSSGEMTTIALSAVEDILKQMSFVIPEIKELRPDVIATKKGIIINLRVTLKRETNLRELSSRLQQMVRSELEDELGLEEELIIRIHIAKITSREESDRKRRELDHKEPPSIPFTNFGGV